MLNNLTKPYSVTFTMLGKKLVKHFSTAAEQKAFASQLDKKGLQHEMHFDAPVEPKPVVRTATQARIQPTITPQATSTNTEVIEGQLRGMEGRATSIGFARVLAPNVTGGVWYRPIKVPYRVSLTFCANCHDYRRFVKVASEYGMVFNQCPECGVPDTDFNTQVTNGTNKF